MKRILVITDFSIVAKNASIYAIELAKISGAKILLYDISTENSSNNEINVLGEIKVEKHNNKQNSYIELSSLKQLSSIEIELLEKKDELIKDILSIEKNENIDLVIMGIKESIDLTGFISGNTITNLIKETIVPLIIIPEKINFKKIQKIVFAVDFILETEIIMPVAVKNFLLCVNPKIVVLNVVKVNAEIMADRVVSENNIEKYFENEDHIYSFIENNNLINGLNDFISCNNIDMITMLPHKHNFFQKMFTESSTKKMAFNTSIPVMICPSDK